ISLLRTRRVRAEIFFHCLDQFRRRRRSAFGRSRALPDQGPDRRRKRGRDSQRRPHRRNLARKRHRHRPPHGREISRKPAYSEQRRTQAEAGARDLVRRVTRSLVASTLTRKDGGRSLPPMKPLAIATLLAITSCASAQAQPLSCPPAGYERAELDALKANQWA